MVKLEKMSIEQYKPWRDSKIKFYAEEKAQVGNVSAEEAMQASKRQFEQILPDGLNTLGNYLFNVKDEDSDHSRGFFMDKGP